MATRLQGRYKGRNPFDLSLKKMRPLMELASEDIYGRGTVDNYRLCTNYFHYVSLFNWATKCLQYLLGEFMETYVSLET